MEFRVLREVAEVIPGTSPKGELITSDGLGYPFFQGVKEFGTVYPTPERYTEKPIRLAQSGDILFSVRAPVGRTNIATSDCAIGRGVMAIRPNSSQDRNHLLYFLRSIEDKWDSLGSTGSVFESINVSNLRELNVTWPNNRLEASEILWKLDEKIRVNQQIASTLEQIAQTIFKSWFIDFDPVHAKARGERPEGMDAETAALFPDSFEDSELGAIPSGWAVKEIGQVLSLVGGSTPSTSNCDYWDGVYTWTTPKDLSSQEGLITVDSARKITDKGLAKITSGLLQKGSVLMSSRAPIGYLAISDVPTAVNQGFIAFPFTKYFHPMFILNWLSSNMDEIKNRSGGSSFAEVSKSAFKTLPMLVPQSPLVHKFGEVAQPILDQLSQITYQNRTLRDLRYSLLPRLISGELEIPAELLEA